MLPFDGALSANNRWVIKANFVPWEYAEEDYSDLFPSETGNVAKPARVALGALIIKETLGISDEETVEQIRENPLKLKETSETVVMMNLIVMNLARRYRHLYVFFSKSAFWDFKAKFFSAAGQFLPAAVYQKQDLFRKPYLWLQKFISAKF